MAKTLFVAFGILLLLASMAHAAATCSKDAYNKACSSCSFDANGKMDQSCYGGYKSSGISCNSAAYPIASGKYAAGQCPQIESCVSELQACQSQYSSGNDKADCQEGSVAVCYSSADFCMSSAAIKCGEVEKQCPGTSAALILPLLLAGFAKFVMKP